MVASSGGNWIENILELNMYDIEMHEMSDDFLECWKAAGIHLDNQVDGGIKHWLRAHP